MKRSPAVAVVRLGAMGDIVHTLPVLPKLQARYPDCALIWVVERPHAPVLQNNHWLEDCLVVDTKEWRRHLRRLAIGDLVRCVTSTHRRMRRYRFIAAYDFQGLIKSGIATRWTGAGQRFGFAADKCREPFSAWFTNHHILPGLHYPHIVDINLSLVGGGSASVPDDFPLSGSSRDREEGALFWQNIQHSHRPRIAVNPAAGWTTKQWAPDKFKRLVKELHAEYDATIVVLWGPNERELAEYVAGNSAIIAPPTSVRQSIELIRRFNLFIGGDTGPMHLAWALGVPCLALFGPTDPRRNGPYGAGHAVVWYRPDCAPCYRRACERSVECLESLPYKAVRPIADRMMHRLSSGERTSLWVEIGTQAT